MTDHDVEEARLRSAGVPQSSQPEFAVFMNWLLGAVSQGITKVERQQRSRPKLVLLKQVREAIAKEISRNFELAIQFWLLTQHPEQVSSEYNARMPRILRSHPLDVQRQVIEVFRAHCPAPGWSICTYCGRLFQAPGEDFCSAHCRKGMQNRSGWLRRKARYRVTAISKAQPNIAP